LFFWQASQEAEEVKNNRGEKALKHAPTEAASQLQRIHMDTLVGLAFSNVVAFFIILTAASTLHTHGITDVSTCSAGSVRLRTDCWTLCRPLFVLGIVGTGLLAVPVLAASTAYGIAEGWNWKTSLERAPRFYAVISVATLIGFLMNFLRIDPVKALVWAATDECKPY